MNKITVTRFAPSPTGSLHIGGARTALFNWLYARSQNGQFLLRIEDTDTRRSTVEAKNEIFSSLEWLGLSWDHDPISQITKAQRHKEVAEYLLEKDLAYRCYATQDEILDFQKNAKLHGDTFIFKSPWRNKSKSNKSTEPFVIRLKTPEDGKTSVTDAIKGKIIWNNNTLDDLILLRRNGSPTYMLAVVVDDYDMNVSDVIRGDDHLTNTARQVLLYKAMSWEKPNFAHLPLIYGEDGMKMSKRHGAISVYDYREMGYPPEALINYLARLGWSHGDHEYFSLREAVRWFSLKSIGNSPSRFDLKKLNNVSKNHIKKMPIRKLVSESSDFMFRTQGIKLTEIQRNIFENSIELIKSRSSNFADIIENSKFFIKKRPIAIEPDDLKVLDASVCDRLKRLAKQLKDICWSSEIIDETIKNFIAVESINFQEIAQPIRLALLGQKSSPSIVQIMYLLGKDESLGRLADSFSAKRI